MHSINRFHDKVNIALAYEFKLSAFYEQVDSYVNALLADFSGCESISVYFEQRSKHTLSIVQDLIPLLVCEAVGCPMDKRVVSLAVYWALNLAASHLLDQGQDQGHFLKVNEAVAALGLANVALAQLETDENTFRDILSAVGQISILGAVAQNDELRNGRVWSEVGYFRNVAGKAASIIATGMWMGGRFAASDVNTLNILREFGTALGMANQISDDCKDLEEDLSQGTYTLPVIKGLALHTHPQHSLLVQLTAQPSLTDRDVRLIADILRRMGTIDACQRIVKAYQVQAAAVFKVIPELEPYFAAYVVPTV